MKRLVWVFLGLILMAASCADEQRNARKKVDALETQLYADTTGVIDPAKGAEMIETYMAYVDSFPNDTIVPLYIFKSAEVAQGIGDYWLSVRYFNRVYKDYPEHPKAPEAAFYQGFVLDTYLNQPNLAIKAFEEFIELYPNHALARDARGMIQMINSGDEFFENIIKEEE
jgi:TolA-binding protein